MSNTNDLYIAWKNYRATRQAAAAEYADALAKLEPYKGSVGYREQADQAARLREERIRQGRVTALRRMNKALEGASAAVEAFVDPAPTEEQLRRLQVLQMREKVSLEELRQAEKAFDGNGACCAVLDEIARKNGHLFVCKPIAGRMSGAQAAKWLDNAKHGVSKSMQVDGSPYSLPARLDRAENEADFVDVLCGGFHSGHTFEGFAGIINA